MTVQTISSVPMIKIRSLKHDFTGNYRVETEQTLTILLAESISLRRRLERLVPLIVAIMSK